MMLVAMCVADTDGIHWSFDSDETFRSSDCRTEFTFHTVKKNIELVRGISGKGIRTDGYSCWLEADLDDDIRNVSGYFALESFPTDNGTLIGIRGGQHTLAVCVDRFGDLQLEVGDGNEPFCHPLELKVSRYEWFHITLSVTDGVPQVALNGCSGDPVGITLQDSSCAYRSLLVGKSFYERKIGMYDITAVNGIIDEISVNCSLPSGRKLSSRLRQVPVLAVPDVRFADDFSRPKYHLIPAANWTNETHGLIYHNGRYHIFNQKNASSIILRQINWGHFTSPDLLHWTEEKPALTPDTPYDKNGIWSGCAVIDDAGVPRLFYTSGGDRMGVGMAYPKDDSLVEWEKSSLNPVIAEKPEEYSRTDMRDQYVWKEGDVWYMIIGFGLQDEGDPRGSLLLYKSEDLNDWTFAGLLFEGNPSVDQTGVFWEMPVFKKMGEKYVLLVNRVPHNGVPARTQYWVGDFKDEKFIPDNPMPQNLEVINRLLSPSVADTPEGQVTAIAIIPDEIHEYANYHQGWAHLYSMPRIWNLKDGKICQSPHPVMEELRRTHKTFVRQPLSDDEPLMISSEGHQMEIDATFYPADARKFGFTLCKNPDNNECTQIYYDADSQELVVDQTHSSQRRGIPLRVRKDSYVLDTSEPVNIRLYVDGSVVEGFINGEDAFTTRIFPSDVKSSQVELFANGKDSEVAADYWTLDNAKVRMNF